MVIKTVFIVFKQNIMTYFSMFLAWNMTPDMFLIGFVGDFPWEFFVSRTISLYADPIMIRDPANWVISENRLVLSYARAIYSNIRPQKLIHFVQKGKDNFMQSLR